jgi:hypothetical protein
MLAAVIVMSVSAGGSTQTDTLIALGAVVVWIVIGAIWLVFNSAATQTSLLVKPRTVAPER